MESSPEDWRADEFWPPPFVNAYGLPVAVPDPRTGLQQALDAPGASFRGEALADVERAEVAGAVRSACVALAEREVAKSERGPRGWIWSLLVLILPFAGLGAFDVFVLGDRWSLRGGSPVLMFLAQFLYAALLFTTWGYLATRRGRPAWKKPGQHVVRGGDLLTAAFALAVTSLTLALSLGAPGVPLALFIASPLGGLVLVGLVAILALSAAAARLLAVPDDPYEFMLPKLAEELSRMRYLSAGRENTRAAFPYVQRRRMAQEYERWARELESRVGATGPSERAFSPDVRAAQRDRDQRLVAWVRDLEKLILAPSADAPGVICERLSQGLIDAGLGDWTNFTSESPAAQMRLARRWLPRLAVAAGLLAVGWLVPLILGSTLSPASTSALRLTLTIAALTALTAPSQALADAASSVKDLGGRRY